MIKKLAIVTCGLAFLAGCDMPMSQPDEPANPYPNLPDNVVTAAAPDQDLTTARLVPEDGCYWYLHTGPVESTLVPLRSASGQRICTAAGA